MATEPPFLRPVKLMKKGIRVFYACSDGRIESGIMVSANTKVVRFADGGWNPADDCYLTRVQCERANQLTPPKALRAIEAARVSLSTASRAIQTALDRMTVE